MTNNFPSWLTKTMLKGIKSFNLDAYLLALEGWRRGLTLRWFYDATHLSDIKIIGFNPIGKIFSLSSRDKTHFFYRSRGDLVSNEAVSIGTDKMLTKKVLLENGVTTPRGKNFNLEYSTNDIVQYVLQHFDFPLVVKPTFGSLGKGVFTNINDKNDILYAIEYIREELKYKDILVEEYINGDEYRVYAVGDEVVACTKKVPPNITGNGKNSISELIDEKNKLRKLNPHLSRKLIKKDENLIRFLAKDGLTLDSVLREGKTVFLNDVANTSIGAESVNMDGVINKNIEMEVVAALKALPSLYHAGVDVIVSNNKAYIIEINPTASFAQHVFPFSGKPINVPEKIIDFYFPETKRDTYSDLKYFNYLNISKMLKERTVNCIEVTNIEIGKPVVKRFIVKGKVQGVGFRQWARREASRFDINGYVRNLKNGNVVVIAWTTDEQKMEKFKEKLYVGSERSKVKEVKELSWEKQLNIGFEIRR